MAGLNPVLPRLLFIGAAAGVFSALLGVGGGVLAVPLLIMLLGYDAKAAAATSLAAIIFTALSGTVTHAALGNVRWLEGVAIGVPAVVGVSLGVAAKHRLSSVHLSYGFAALLLVIAVLVVVR